MPTEPVAIACFGEALWDVLPRGIFLGGAPINTAYHLSRLGVKALAVSAVGFDFLGGELSRRLHGWGIETSGMAEVRDRPTGTVQATIDQRGNARYRINRGVAWDRITAIHAIRFLPVPEAIVFGTLALRENHNRGELDGLLAQWPKALRVLDLNLRAPFDRPKALNFAMRRADIVKLNDVELAQLTGASSRRTAALEAMTRRFAAKHDLDRVCVSAGDRGAGLLWHGAWYWEKARPVVVRDTIGAGDAFLAGLLHELLVQRATPARALARACRLGEFVAACDGATPPYRVDRQGRPRLTG